MRCKNKHWATGVLAALLLMPFLSWAEEPSAAEGYYQRAKALRLQAKLGEAERLYHRALYTDPYLQPAYVELIDMYITQQRAEEGLQLVDKALALFSTDAELWVRKGLLLRQTGRQAESQFAYDRAENLAPSNPHILRRVSGFYTSQGDAAKAEALDTRRKQLEPGPPPRPLKTTQPAVTEEN